MKAGEKYFWTCWNMQLIVATARASFEKPIGWKDEETNKNHVNNAIWKVYHIIYKGSKKILSNIKIHS